MTECPLSGQRNLPGRVAFVTGTAGGMGHAVRAALSAGGAGMIATDIVDEARDLLPNTIYRSTGELASDQHASIKVAETARRLTGRYFPGMIEMIQTGGLNKTNIW